MGPPDPEKAQLPALIDGVKGCSVLRVSQLEGLRCRAIASQLGPAPDPAAAKNQRGMTAVVKPLEIAEYRLAPEDHVIKKGPLERSRLVGARCPGSRGAASDEVDV